MFEETEVVDVNVKDLNVDFMKEVSRSKEYSIDGVEDCLLNRVQDEVSV